MEEKLTKIRSEEVRVKFQPDMKKRVDRIAAMHGTPTATWCHQVIAKAVVDLERQYQLLQKIESTLTDLQKNLWIHMGTDNNKSK